MSLTVQEQLSTLKLVGKNEFEENYNGSYRFAPIEEAEVSRAMIKRYYTTMYERAISDVVIVGAGSVC
jgi:thiamine thiazole synthase